MANDISTQMRDKLDSLEAAVIAMESLSGVAAGLSDAGLLDYSNLHHFVVQELTGRFADVNKSLRERVLPLVADLQGVARA